jgi:hypothetical protein
MRRNTMKPDDKTFVSLLCNHPLGCARSHTLTFLATSFDLVPEGKQVRADAEAHGWDTVNDLCPDHKK